MERSTDGTGSGDCPRLSLLVRFNHSKSCERFLPLHVLKVKKKTEKKNNPKEH